MASGVNQFISKQEEKVMDECVVQYLGLKDEKLAEQTRVKLNVSPFQSQFSRRSKTSELRLSSRQER